MIIKEKGVCEISETWKIASREKRNLRKERSKTDTELKEREDHIYIERELKEKEKREKRSDDEGQRKV